jgi:hypothetical protein
MIGKKMRAGTDIVDSSSHFSMIGAQLWFYVAILSTDVVENILKIFIILNAHNSKHGQAKFRNKCMYVFSTSS